MRKLSALILFSIYLVTGCRAFTFQKGDLLFLTEGVSSFSEAIASSTGKNDSVRLVHVGMVCDPDSGGNEGVIIIEASPQEGVRKIGLTDFIKHASLIDGKPGIIVKRLKDSFPLDEAIERAETRLGEEYDWYYLPDNGMTYCSELIYDSYLDSEGAHIFTAYPMNFRRADGTMPEFWTELCKKLGVDVPEGIPGTNPNDMSKDIKLIEVYRFF